MGLFDGIGGWWRATQDRRDFDAICDRGGLRLDWAANRGGVQMLREVFVERAYADWFPLHRPACVVDVGAHFGYFSLFALRHLAPAGSRVVAVEPCAASVAILRENLAANGGERVEVVEAGVGGRTGRGELLLGSRAQNHSLYAEHHQRLRRPAAGERAVVDLFSLEDLLTQLRIERVDFLKLDCEGAEYPALFEAPAGVLARIGTISLEFHDLGAAGQTGLSLAEHLRRHNFEIVRLEHGPTWIDNDYGRLIATRG